MITIYVADDGVLFYDEYECEAYEWKLNHPNLKDVHVFNKDGVEFEDIYSEDAYNYSEKIVVPNEEALRDLQELAHYTGYCCYEDIDKVGEWVFDKKRDTFIEVIK